MSGFIERVPRARRSAVLVAAAALGVLVAGVSVPAPASADPSTWFAYPQGGAGGPVACPQTTVVADECTLSQALGLAQAGDTVALAVSGDESDSSTFYSGGFTVSTSGTSADAPLTIEPASGVTDPILDGGGGLRVLNVSAAGAHLVLDGLTVQNGRGDRGSGVLLANGDNLAVSGCTFADDVTTGDNDGGAIASGTAPGATGTVTVAGSAFTDDTASGAYSASAIASGTDGGTGSLTVSDSTFTDDSSSATYGMGAIGSAEDGGSGSLAVSGSTFSGDSSFGGGAMGLGFGGTLTGTVSDSTFTGNSGADGGAIDNGDFGGTSTLTVTGSTFTQNTASKDGGAIDSGDQSSSGYLTVTGSTFTGNSAQDHGGAIDSEQIYGDDEPGTATVLDSTLAGDSVGEYGGSEIEAWDEATVTVGGDVLDGTCLEAVRSWTDLGYNTASGSSCFSSPAATGDDDSAGSGLSGLIGALGGNGGPTQTMALLVGNPGVSAIPDGTTVGGTQLCPVSSDQRGVPSPSGQACDAGAVQLAGQSVQFTSTPPADPTVGGTYQVSATASSGLAAVFSVDPSTPAGVCSVSGSQVSFTGAGTCVVDAAQGGDNQSGTGNWLAAQTVSQSIVVTAPQVSLSFTGSLGYRNSGDVTSGRVTVNPATGQVESVTGEVTIPGLDGGSATVQIAVVRLLGYYLGEVTVYDPGAHLSAVALVATTDLSRVGAGGVSSTAVGLNGLRPYTLTFTV